MASKGKIRKKIEEVVNIYCPNGKWCLLKEIMISKYTDPRFFVQLKCLEHFKYEESQTQGEDIGWNEAHYKWMERGFAKAFADYYDEDLTAEQIYKKILENIP